MTTKNYEKATKILAKLILESKDCNYDQDLFDGVCYLLETNETSPLVDISQDRWELAKKMLERNNECYIWEAIVPKFAEITYGLTAKNEAEHFLLENLDSDLEKFKEELDFSYGIWEEFDEETDEEVVTQIYNLIHDKI